MLNVIYSNYAAYNFILLHPALDIVGDEAITVGFKLIESKGNACLGIFNKNILENREYKIRDIQARGYGYAIRPDGVIHSPNTEDNFKMSA